MKIIVIAVILGLGITFLIWLGKCVDNAEEAIEDDKDNIIRYKSKKTNEQDNNK
jgi:hypothetical protein